MKIKTLLLGSAAVLSVVGAARAADTTPAPAPARAVVAAPAVKPVAYVTVCDAFGLGYFYIPGQMATCFRLQGQIQFSINFHTRDTEGPYATTTSPHEAGWDSQAQGQLTFTAKRMTDHGDLTGVIRMVGLSSNSQNIAVAQLKGGSCVGGGSLNCRVPVDRYVQMDRAFITYGGLEVGYDNSAYGIGTTKQMTFSWDIGSVTARLGFDDPRDRWGSRLPRYYWMPDVIGSLNGDLPVKGRGNWGLSVGLANIQQWPTALTGTGGVPTASTDAAAAGTLPTFMAWGVSGRIQLNTNAIAKGDQLTFSGTVGTGCAFISNNCGQNTLSTGLTMYQVIAQFRHVFTPNLNSTWQIRYTDPNPRATITDAQAQVTWTPINVGGFSMQNQLTANTTLFNGTPPVVLSGQIRFQLQY